MTLAWRILGTIALTAGAIFGVFGFLAAFELQGVRALLWKLGYLAFAVGLLVAAIEIWREKK